MQIYLSQEQANRIGEKFMDLGNLILAGLVLGQIVPSVKFNPYTAMAGFFGFVFSYMVG
ncbi:MAG: hypothetical protein ABFQ62_01905 [Patescibacteria group bacterium]